MTIEVTKARTMSPKDGSLTIVAGPPGLGKSWFSGTVANYVDPSEVLLLATLPREVNSLMYQEYDLDTVLLTDDNWDPGQGKQGLQATGYDRMMDILRDLRQDNKYKAIILDNGTEAAELAWHSVMAPLGVSDPNELGRGSNRFAPYMSLREKMEQMIRSLSVLTGKTGLVETPKLIIVPWHVQPKKDTSDDDESADQKGQGAEYEGDYLPMIRGGFRRRVAALVDNYVYASIETVRPKGKMTSENRFCIQVVSDREKHVKLAGVAPDPDSLVKGRFLDVHDRKDAWSMFMKVLGIDKEGD